MAKIIEAAFNAQGMKFAFVVSRFNDFITDKLLSGATECYTKHGGNEAELEVYKVPGAFEIPVVAQKLASTRKYDGIVCLGCVIRGGTPHFDYVAGEAVKGMASVAQQTGIPVGFGVLTVENIEQAIERAGSKHGNKGWEACLSVIETAGVLKRIKSEL